MRASWLKLVGQLDFPHKQEVLLEDFVDSGLHIILSKDAELEKAEQKDNEIQLMASTVVKPLVMTEAFFPVDLELGNCRCKLWVVVDSLDLSRRVGEDTVKPRFERFVAKPHGLLNGRGLINPLGKGYQQLVKRTQVLSW